MTSRLLARAALGICAVMWAGHATAQSGARAVATLTYDGRSVNLDRVLVVQSGNEEGLEDAPQLRIFLSDKDIPLTVAGGASILDAKQFVDLSQSFCPGTASATRRNRCGLEDRKRL